jgi:lysophospholipase L1-like esterase
LVLGLIVALGCVLTLEALARVAATVRDDLRPQPLKWYRYDADLGWDRQPGFSGVVFGAERRFADDGLLAEDARSLTEHPDWPRVIALGDSTTFGDGVPADRTWCAQLRRLLPGVNVVNLGMIGYTSYQGLRILEKRGLAMKPAAIVVSFNFNDRRFVLPPDRPDGLQRFGRLARVQSLRQVARHVYLARLLARLLDRPLGQPATDDESKELRSWHSPLTHVDVRSLRPRVSPEDYRRNLEAMVALARGRGIPVAFVLLADNPRDKGLLEEGIAQARAGRPTEAARTLETQLGEKNLYRILARIELSRLYEQADRPADHARVAFIDHPVDTLHGGEPVQRDAVYDRAMREAAQALDVPLVEAGAALAARPEVYMDFCHFNAEGHRIVAEALAPVIGGILARRERTH